MATKQLIPQHVLDDVRTRADIVDIVSEAVSLKKSGQNLMGLCPFHAEKTPSFTVSPEKRIYHCFGCGAGGNVFKFLMETRNLSFMDAVRLLADRYGVPLPRAGSGGENDPKADERDLLLQIHRWAAEYFMAQLQQPDGGKPALDYIGGRHFNPETLRQYRIGWAPQEWRGLTTYLQKKGDCPPPLLDKSGLAKFGDNGPAGGCYDRFRGRIVIPLQDIHGNIIGFAGRVLDDQQPKYLNSPETVLFKKGHHLFGLHAARQAIRKQNRVFVMEGYFDQMRAVQAGILNAVATCGTALTPQQATLLKTHASRATLVFDSDSAGQAATDRGFDVLLEHGLQTDVIVLPPGHDPDTYIQEFGAEGFLGLADQSAPYVEYFIRKIMREENIALPAGRIAIVNRAIPLLSRIKNAVERSEHIRFLSEALGVEGRSLLQELKKALDQNRPSVGNAEARPAPAKQDAETYLIHLLLHDATAARMIRERVEPGEFRNTAFGKTAALIYETLDADRPLHLDVLMDGTQDEEIRNILSQSGMAAPAFDNPAKAATDCIILLRKEQAQGRIDGMQKEMFEAEKSGETQRSREIYQKIRDIQNSLKVAECRLPN